MLFVLLVFIISLFVAGTAAWFSILGLMAIFAGSAVSIAIMAGGLEAAKLLTASWLYRNWHDSPKMLKWPLTFMTVVLMIITSLGIFGFLSKAHIEQGAPVGNNVAKIERLEQRIAREQKVIDDATSVVLQLDEAVNTLIEYDRIRGPNGSIAVRESQKDERASLSSTINEAQTNIDTLTDEKFELENEVRAFEVEVGPIKYVADIIYGPDAGKSALESAVQWLIIIIIFVFDPLAVLLLIAANYSLIDYGIKLRPQDEKERIRKQYSTRFNSKDEEARENTEENQQQAQRSGPEEESLVKEVNEHGSNLEITGDQDDDKNKKPTPEGSVDSVIQEVDSKSQDTRNVENTSGEGERTDEEGKNSQEGDMTWDEEESDRRMNVIAQNGNTGEHYDEVVLAEEDQAKSDDKVTDNNPRGIRGWLLTDKRNKEI